MKVPGAPAGLLERAIRANPAYEVVLADRLGDGQRAALGKLADAPDFYGVLRGREGTALPIHALSCESALLFLSLQEPGTLPKFAVRKLGGDAETTLRQLVMDGVLEIEVGAGFVSGAAASAHCRTPEADSLTDVGGRLGCLARAALHYVRSLGLDDAMQASAKLYSYNRYPLSPRRVRSFSAPSAVDRFIGLDGGPLARALDASFLPLELGKERAAWRAWRPRRAVPLSAPRPQVTHKLYVSPVWSATGEAFAGAIAALGTARPRQLKIGRELAGILRPDKLVVYFASLDDMGEAAERLRTALAGCAAQGVPFTAEAGGDGLLSWGLDPPMRHDAVPWQERESWRWWVTNRLAAALLSANAPARSGDGDADAVRFALERIALEGFDPRTWVPSSRMWRDLPVH